MTGLKMMKKKGEMASDTARIDHHVEVLASKLRRRLVAGAQTSATETAKLLQIVVRMSRCADAEALRSLVAEKARTLVAASNPVAAVSSVANRVGVLLLEETRALEATKEYPAMLPEQRMKALRDNVADAVKELADEIDNAQVNIASQALEHIHSNEIIMTLGRSSSVERFLKEAAKLRKFQVIVAETSPSYDGQAMALTLAQAGIDTTLITDASIFAVMSRVNKVILGTHAVLANGGLVAMTGSHVIAAAAKHYSTPVVVLAELYKMSGTYPFDADDFYLHANADAVFGFEDGFMIDQIDVVNPTYDFVDPDLVNLFITNDGAYPPSYVSRLIYEDSQIV